MLTGLGHGVHRYLVRHDPGCVGESVPSCLPFPFLPLFTFLSLPPSLTTFLLSLCFLFLPSFLFSLPLVFSQIEGSPKNFLVPYHNLIPGPLLFCFPKTIPCLFKFTIPGSLLHLSLRAHITFIPPSGEALILLVRELSPSLH